MLLSAATICPCMAASVIWTRYSLFELTFIYNDKNENINNDNDYNDINNNPNIMMLVLITLMSMIMIVMINDNNHVNNDDVDNDDDVIPSFRSYSKNPTKLLVDAIDARLNLF